ncbi:ABC transporter permease [Cognatishimia maritima]|uniref:Putative spermidine/putrescine transport system permease protein n=1 Tax=Cognatishimia maritima TaxID=870908 RepID=A0A1M5UPU4_9RHOB|nr:ABC transporter permease [Cognatishimia maritima]SHH64673.1 putative spermidine/putrescine transport system permease protein [Cognatishimia maritima]
MSTTTLKTWQAYAFAAPAFIALLPFLVACVFILRFSLSGESTAIEGFSIRAYQDLMTPFFGRSVWLTLRLALIATIAVMFMAVPLAFLLTSLTSPLTRRLLTVTILLPMILNLLVQAYGWTLLLGPSGALNKVLQSLGLIERPLFLLFNETGVLLGLIQTSLPLAVFPIVSAVRGISREHLEAASSLGANNWRVLKDVTLPLLRPALVGAGSIVFAFNASAFAIPLLLGGRRVQMLGVAIRDMISPLFNWSGAAAAGMILILMTLLVLVTSAWLVRVTTEKTKG